MHTSTRCWCGAAPCVSRAGDWGVCVSVGDAVPPAPSCGTPEQPPSGQGKAVEERGHRAGAGLDFGRAPGAFGPRRRWLRAPYVTAAGPWWGRGTETGGRRAPQNQKGPGAEAGCPPLVERGGSRWLLGVLGPARGSSGLPPVRCGAGSGHWCRSPRGELPPARLPQGLPWGRGSTPEPPRSHPKTSAPCGAGELWGIPDFGGKRE